MLKDNKTFLFLAADRVGNERDYFAKKEIMFYGSSVAIMFNPTKFIKNLDIKNEGYLLIDTYLPWLFFIHIKLLGFPYFLWGLIGEMDAVKVQELVWGETVAQYLALLIVLLETRRYLSCLKVIFSSIIEK